MYTKEIVISYLYFHQKTIKIFPFYRTYLFFLSIVSASCHLEYFTTDEILSLQILFTLFLTQHQSGKMANINRKILRITSPHIVLVNLMLSLQRN